MDLLNELQSKKANADQVLEALKLNGTHPIDPFKVILDNEIEKSIEYLFKAVNFCKDNNIELSKKNSYNLLSTIIYKYSPDVIDKDKKSIALFIKRVDENLPDNPKKELTSHLTIIKTTCENNEFPIEQFNKL
jgi:hypothetical protein